MTYILKGHSGDYKEVLQEGFKEIGVLPLHIHLADNVTEIKELFSQIPYKFAYLKGSHHYHLENLIAN